MSLNLTEKGIRASILREVRKLDPFAKATKSWPAPPGFSVLGETIRVEIKEDRVRGYGASAHDHTGRWRVAVGEWRDTRRFAAQKNDFDYAAIAALIVKRAEGETCPHRTRRATTAVQSSASRGGRRDTRVLLTRSSSCTSGSETTAIGPTTISATRPADTTGLWPKPRR